jgi:hypothetical protein
MHWLVICLVVTIVLSPLMWLKQSPRQLRIATLRRKATENNFTVSLHRRPDARDDEMSLDCVLYKLTCKDLDISGEWVLHRYSQRGWESKWSHWNWIFGEADSSWDDVLAQIIVNLPNGVSAIKKQKDGFSVIWDESGGEPEFLAVCDSLRMLHEHNKK